MEVLFKWNYWAALKSTAGGSSEISLPLFLREPEFFNIIHGWDYKYMEIMKDAGKCEGVPYKIDL